MTPDSLVMTILDELVACLPEEQRAEAKPSCAHNDVPAGGWGGMTASAGKGSHS